MHLQSKSFEPYAFMDIRLAFGRYDERSHVALSDNRNPHLAWSNVPEGTRSFAVLCWDPDVPTVPDDVNQEGRSVPLDLPRTDFFHWVLVDLPADLREIQEGAHSNEVVPKGKSPGASPDGGLQGLNNYTDWFAGDPDMGGQYAGYDGAGPPWNDARIHGYVFAVYALDVPSLGLSGAFTGADVRKAMDGHVLAQASITGLYTLNPDVGRRVAEQWADAWPVPIDGGTF